jgi:ABC-type nitrate/sulfonate/bicarbonate transport system substrate-binding protein
MRRLLFGILIVILTSCQAVGGPTPAATSGPLSMVFMPGYKPQANLPFVGVYVAQEKGFFAEQDLTVTIQPSPGQGQHLQLTAAGKVQVTTQDAAVMLQRRADPGLPLVSIALLGQRGQQAFAALSASGMKTPKDWEGKTVGYKGAIPPDLLALISASGADKDKIELINVGFDPRLLVEGKVDVYPVFKSNEPWLLRSWGEDIMLWEAADFGVPTLGLTYVTSDDTLRQNPEVLARFLRGALKGIDYATAHADEAIQIVMKYAGPETDPDNMRFMFETELKDAQGEATQGHIIGWQTAAQWQSMADMLRKEGALTGTVDINQAFTTQILEMVK